MSVPPAAAGDVVTINVGGKLFQATTATLSAAGPASPLSSLSPSATPHFFDRDPTLFPFILSLLRRRADPSRSPLHFLPLVSSAIAAEADHFGIPRNFIINPPFSPFALSPSVRLPLAGRDAAIAVSFSTSGNSLAVAHGGRITAFDSALAYKETVLTPLLAVDSLASVSPTLVAAGAGDYPGLHLVPFGDAGSAISVLHWSNAGTAGNVQSIAVSPEEESLVFAGFESARRNASAVVGFDIERLAPVVEIEHRDVFGAEVEAALPAMRLEWLHGKKLLLAAGSHTGPGGVTGDIRLYDVRSNAASPVWEWKEKEDCFADLSASDALGSLFKVGVFTGQVYTADLRKIDSPEPWMCLNQGQRAPNAVQGQRVGSGCRMVCHENWVFVTRGADVEVWSELELAAPIPGEGKKVMRRNRVGKGNKATEEKIIGLAFGGDRMAVTRVDEQSVEVWESMVKLQNCGSAMKEMRI